MSEPSPADVLILQHVRPEPPGRLAGVLDVREAETHLPLLQAIGNTVFERWVNRLSASDAQR